jgi:hypothetical protein
MENGSVLSLDEKFRKSSDRDQFFLADPTQCLPFLNT